MNIKVLNSVFEINEKIFLIQHECVRANPSKNGIMINISVRVKNQMVRVLIKIIICEILAPVIVNVARRVKLTNIQISQNFHTEKAA